MVVKVKHELPQQVVKEKIKQLLEMTVQKHSGFITAHEFIWNEYSCDIHLSAMKMQFKGIVVVHKDDVEVEVKVPLIFFGYQSKIKTVIEDELNKMLK
jgi:hypothetical protein